MANIGSGEISKIQTKESSAPSTPSSGYGYLYEKTDGYIYFKNDAGTEYNLTTGGGGAISAIEFVIDGGGSEITTGIKGDLEVPFDCVINRVTLLADQSGDIVIDIWKDTYANFPPTDADTITGGDEPTISSDTDSQDDSLGYWDTVIDAGDILRFNVDSVTTITRVTLSLKVTKSQELKNGTY